jgi:hypothetical protein
MDKPLPEGADDVGGSGALPPGRDPAEYTKSGRLRSAVY